MVIRSKAALSEQESRSRVGRVSGAGEVREREVSWCEMPGAVNPDCGRDEVHNAKSEQLMRAATFSLWLYRFGENWRLKLSLVILATTLQVTKRVPIW